MMRVGIFGVAHVHAAAYVANIAANSTAELVGLSESDAEVRGMWTSSHGTVPREDHAALADEVDAAIICTTTADHLPIAELLAERSVPTLCEKPIATSMPDAQAIVDLYSTSSTPLMTAFPMRFSPSLLAGKEMLENGQIGTALAFTGQNQSHIPTDYAAWFADPEAAGGGAVMDHTVHVLDALRWWTGATPVEVYADVNSILHPAELVETAGLVTVTFDDGTFATIDCSWSRPEGYPTWGGLDIEALGTEGSFSVNAFGDRLRTWSAGGESWVDWGADPNQAMIDHFIDVASGNAEPLVTGTDGLVATQVALAAYESHKRGQPLQISDL